MPSPLGLPPSSPLLIVLSGPSGVGKDAVLHALRERDRRLVGVVTATTRPQRPGERDGVHYLFVTEGRFQEMIAQGQLLEWAQVYGHWYGVPRAAVAEALAQGQDVVLKTDVQGAATLKRLAPEGLFIFLAPPSLEELAWRLRARHTEDAGALNRRLETARAEMERLPLFDYVVVNDEVAGATARIQAILLAEQCRTRPRQVRL